MSEQQDLIEQFVRVTSASTYLAQQYLDRNNGDLIGAIEDFYANKSASPNERTDKKRKGYVPKYRRSYNRWFPAEYAQKCRFFTNSSNHERDIWTVY